MMSNGLGDRSHRGLRYLKASCAGIGLFLVLLWVIGLLFGGLLVLCLGDHLQNSASFRVFTAQSLAKFREVSRW